MMRTALLSAFIFLFAALSVFAQNDWKAKDVDKWDKQDVEKILFNSEYAKSQEVRLQYSPTQVAAAGALNEATLGNPNTISQGGIAPAVSFVFTLRLRSSLAIRLALIRKNQLETKTEKLSKEELDLFNRRQKGLYECPACRENYVLTLTSRSSENKNFDAVYAAFASARIDELKRYIYLQNEKGEKRPLVNFVAPKAPGAEAIFFFPRLDEKGNPLFTKESKYLIFNVTNNEVNPVTNFKIEIQPIVVADQVQF